MPRYKDNGAIDTRSGGTGFITHPAGVLLYGTGDVGPSGLAQLSLGGAGQLLRSSGAAPFWHDGGWTDVPFLATNYFASVAGGWTVGATDIGTHVYARDFNREIKLLFKIGATTVASTPAYLAIAMPLGLTISRTVETPTRCLNGGVWNTGICLAVAGTTFVQLYKFIGGGNWSNETDLTEVYGEIIIPV